MFIYIVYVFVCEIVADTKIFKKDIINIFMVYLYIIYIYMFMYSESSNMKLQL